MIHQIAQKSTVIAQAQQGRVGQRSAQPADGVIAVTTVHNNFGNHRVVIRRNNAALANTVINAYTGVQGFGGLPPQHGASLRCEARIRIFHIQAGLDGVAGERDVSLSGRQGLAGRHAQLPFHQVEAGDHLRHRVLHLQAGVHLQEVVVELVIHNEFHRARTAVTHRQRGRYGVFAHSLAHARCHRG